MRLAKNIVNNMMISSQSFISDFMRPRCAPFAPPEGDTPHLPRGPHQCGSVARTHVYHPAGFGLTFVRCFRQNRNNPPMNSMTPPEGRLRQGAGGNTQASSIRGGRCVRSHIGRQSRLTCPGKTAAQRRCVWPGEGLSRKCRKADGWPHAASLFGGDEQCLT